MKHAVIYARYSSDKQNEMSIEGQIKECRGYAKKHDLVVLSEYIDRAQSATTDKRPEFLRMISDSEDGYFDTILVYQLDRFARNKEDSGYYKKILRDNGVKVVSAKEQISSDSSGVITEGMLEIVADWFSKQLSEKVNRGMRLRAEQAKHNGGNMPMGFDTDSEGHYILDPVRAPIIKEIYQRTVDGETSISIIKDLEQRGVKTIQGRTLKKNAVGNILRNEMYKGVYKYDDIRIENAVPRIVDDETFDEVQLILERRKTNRGHRPAKEEFLLTGKLYCGSCKTLMTGTSGTSQTGSIYRYYTCKRAPRKCDKRNIKKENLEQLVMEFCRSLITDKVIDDVVASTIEMNKKDQESLEIRRLRRDIKDTQKKAEELLEKIESGIASSLITQRLLEREKELENLKRQLQIEERRMQIIDTDEVKDFLIMIRDGKINNEKYRKILLKTFIDRIYLYDNYFSIMLNYSGRKGRTTDRQVIDIELELEGKEVLYPDLSAHQTARSRTLFFYRGGFAVKVKL